MTSRSSIINAMKECGVIAVLRSKNQEEATSVARSCLKGGIKLIEITFSTPGADQVIASLSRSEEFSNAVIGAGTVLDAPTARLAIIAGAKFIVAPTFDKEVAKICNLYAVPYVPGVMTINETLEALKYGLEVVKLFPGSEFKPGFIKALHGPIPQVDVMATGGVNVQNTAEWISAGAIAVGVGGNLTTVKEGQLVDKQGVFEDIVSTAMSYVEAVKEGRK